MLYVSDSNKICDGVFVLLPTSVGVKGFAIRRKLVKNIEVLIPSEQFPGEYKIVLQLEKRDVHRSLDWCISFSL